MPAGCPSEVSVASIPPWLLGASCPAWHAYAVVKGKVTGSFTGVSTRETLMASHGLLSRQQKRVDVLKAFKLRLVNPLYDVPRSTGRRLRVAPVSPPSGTILPTDPRSRNRNPGLEPCRVLPGAYSSSGVSCTGSLVNCVSKLSRP